MKTANVILKELIKEKNFQNVDAFAKQAQIPYRTIARMLKSEYDFWHTTAHNLYKVCKTLDVPVEIFFEEDGLVMRLTPDEAKLIQEYRNTYKKDG